MRQFNFVSPLLLANPFYLELIEANKGIMDSTLVNTSHDRGARVVQLEASLLVIGHEVEMDTGRPGQQRSLREVQPRGTYLVGTLPTDNHSPSAPSFCFTDQPCSRSNILMEDGGGDFLFIVRTAR